MKKEDNLSKSLAKADLLTKSKPLQNYISIENFLHFKTILASGGNIVARLHV
jgi:hypothetical protein